MRLFFTLFMLCTLATAQADTVYLCKRNGKPLYTASPVGEDCRPVDVKVREPDPAEVERMRQDQQRWEAERRAQEEKEQEERRLRAQEDAARAAERSAEAAEENARYQRELMQRQQQDINRAPYFVYPAMPYHPRHRFPRHGKPGGGGWRNGGRPMDQPVPPSVPQPAPPTP